MTNEIALTDDTPIEQEIERVTGLDDDAFRRVVEEELQRTWSRLTDDQRRRTELLYEVLSRSQNVLRWITVLEQSKVRLESNIGARERQLRATHSRVPYREYIDKLRTYEEWKSRSLRSLATSQERLIHARRLRHEHFGHVESGRVVEERNRLSQENVALRTAISTHKTRVIVEYDPTPADEELWKVIERTTATSERAL
jgi:hypothetical protein